MSAIPPEKGISKQNPSCPLSVIDSLEKSLVGYDFNMMESSRTDAGVHAVTNTVYLTLKDSDKVRNTDLTKLTMRMNIILRNNADQIRIAKIVEVSPQALPKVISRRYMYRLGVIKSIHVKDNTKYQLNQSIFLNDKCHILLPPFDVDLFLEAAELISGRQDIRNFTNVRGLKEFKPDYVRDIAVTVKRGHPHTIINQLEVMKNTEFWDIHFESRAYIYRQIRNMIGFMVNYSKKKLTFQEAKSFLQDDWSYDNEKKKYVTPAPPSALHLLNIEYTSYDASRNFKEMLSRPHRDLLRILTYLQFGVGRYAKDNKSYWKNPGSTPVKKYLRSLNNDKKRNK